MIGAGTVKDEGMSEAQGRGLAHLGILGNQISLNLNL